MVCREGWEGREEGAIVMVGREDEMLYHNICKIWYAAALT